MRFEIRTGGVFLILLGLGLLSGSVFLLGLVAGYEMGHQQEGNHQFASVYPLPAPPAAAASPASASETAPAPAAQPPMAAAPTPAPALTPAAETGAVASAPVGVAPPPASAPIPGAPPPVVSAPAASEPEVAAKPPAPKSPAIEGSTGATGEPDISAPIAQRRKGYSIQIEAVMDRSGADSMVAKLRHLGYEGYLVETLIGGETWYRVRIGPFPTEAGAQAAEQKLHDQYNGSVSEP